MTKSKKDNINPDHYKFNGIEVIDYLKAVLSPEEYKGFLKGNCIKYLSRGERKGLNEDYAKSKWYNDKLVELTKETDV